ncbi:MAG: membrane protein insertase YidC [Planctomycetota bacterium]|nr:MAG: membrane protein insertase YidC [Planctomycetota bacterium]
MKARTLLTLVLWGIAALFIAPTCAPPPEETGGGGPAAGARPERFDDAERPAEEFFVLENEHLWTKWSTRGGGCVQVRLKDYTSRLDVEGPLAEEDWLVLYNAPEARPPAAGGEPGAVNYRRRDGLRLWEPKGVLGTDLDAADWTLEGIRDTAGGGREAVLRLRTPAGVELEKRLRVPAGARHVELDFTATPTEEVSATGYLHFRLGTGGGVLVERDRFYPNPYAAAGRFEEGRAEDMEIFRPRGKLPPDRNAAASWRGRFAFVLEGSKYFLSAIRPIGEVFEGAVCEVLLDQERYEELVLEAFPAEERDRALAVLGAVRDLGAAAAADQAAAAVGEDPSYVASVLDRFRRRTAELAASGYAGAWMRTSIAGDFQVHVGGPGSAPESQSFQWYLGPKDPAVFAQGYEPLVSVIEHVDYGGSFFYRIFFTEWIAPAILALLKLFHLVTGNWGAAIILLTILVRASLFPVNRHSQVKMAVYQAKMAKVKPQLDEINRKYAKDPAKKQEATMKLYREHRLSPPLGGCLPMLLQFPVFIGLFAALRCSILLRQQPFVGWIRDLSRPDALIDFGGPVLDFFPFSGVTTLNVLPIVMVFLWVAHQRSMPKPTDPQQAQMQKMMAFMPILFGVMLYNYAAGLSLYMITSSALGIFEQKVIKKRWPVAAPAVGK